MIQFRFDIEKSTEAGALLLEMNGGLMNTYGFIKMLYFADREALARWDFPITGDKPVSMEHGPVLSGIYDLTKGGNHFYRAHWSRFISDTDRETNLLTLKETPTEKILTDAEKGILEAIHREFKAFDFTRFKRWSHKFAEYDESVGKSSSPIAIEAWLQALQKSEAQIAEVREVEDSKRSLEALFS
jgi:uncharacterized phage-associated protein